MSQKLFNPPNKDILRAIKGISDCQLEDSRKVND